MAVVAAGWAELGRAEEAAGIEADIVLRQGTLHDGTGGPAVVGDVAIRDGQIVAVGEFTLAAAGRELDCRGLLVTPGFIDLHNHSDRQMVDRKTRACVNYLLQGCTTIVTGNCGSGPVEVAKYYDQIAEGGAGVNVAHLVPQGSLRDLVLGKENRPATDDELRRMQQLVEQGMRDGAWGLSSGLIYVPSSYADTPELVALASVVARHGGIYASHIRGEGTQLLESVTEALEIGKQARLPVHISHFKSSGQDAWGLVRVAIELIEQRREGGQRVTADQYPYIASSTSLTATLLPTWAQAGGAKAMLERLDDAEQGPRIREAIARKLRICDDGQRLRITSYRQRPQWAGKSLRELAAAEGVTPLELAEGIIRQGGAGIVNFGMSENDVRLVMSQSWVATSSDGRAYVPGPDVPHPRSYGTFARKIGRYALQDEVIPLELAIRSATGLPADILQLPDRGYLRVGCQADVVVFDPEQYLDQATFESPHQYSRGVRHVLVNGQPAVADGVPTGLLAGVPLRHPAAQASDAAQANDTAQENP